MLSPRRLFDHLVGEVEQRRRHRKAEHLRSPQVDNQLKIRRRLNRKLARLRPPEDAINIRPRRTKRSSARSNSAGSLYSNELINRTTGHPDAHVLRLGGA